MSVDLKLHYQQFDYTVTGEEPIRDSYGRQIEPRSATIEIRDGKFASMYVSGMVYTKGGPHGFPGKRIYMSPDKAPGWVVRIVAATGFAWPTEDEAASA